MDIPGIGAVTKDAQFGWYYSQPISVPVLGGQKCRIVVEGYDDDPRKDQFHVALKNFLSLGESVLRECEQYVHRYYKDCIGVWDLDDKQDVAIESPNGVWDHIQFGDEPVVKRRAYGDKGLYVSLECRCYWEPEHGLQIVFKNGLTVNKVGAYDGHLTHSDAYDDDSLEDVVYGKA